MELVYNLLYGNIPTSQKTINTLKPHKKLVDRLLSPTVSLTKKQRLLANRYDIFLLLLKALQPFLEENEVHEEVLSGSE